VAPVDGIRAGRRSPIGFTAGLVTCVLAAFWGAPLAAQTPAGTVIANRALSTFAHANGGLDSAASDTVTFTVGRLGGITLVPAQSVQALPGDSVVFAHTLTNTQNLDDAFTLNAVSSAGWPVSVFHDRNGNGSLDAGDTPWAGADSVPAGAATAVLIVVAVPDTRAVRGVTDLVTVTAISFSDAAVQASLQDTITIPDAGVVLDLTKLVDRASATPGDVLAYVITYSASGTVVAAGAQLRDTIPQGTSYVPGSLAWNGVPLTDAPGDDAGELAGGRLTVRLGDLAPGANGTVSFRVTLEPTAAAAVWNVAFAGYGTAAGVDTATSDTARTVVQLATLAFDKVLETTGPVQFGDAIAYRLSWQNTSGTLAARDAVLVDTLPAGVTYQSSVPAAQVNGPVLTWPLGDLAPGASGEVQLTVQVTHTGLDTLMVRNAASLAGLNASAEAATATGIEVVNAGAATVALTKTANVLEVGLGEVAPFTLAVENTGDVPLAGVVILDSLPDGGRYVPASAVGADSAAADSGAVRFYVAGPIDAGATHLIRYQMAVVSAATEILENSAVATVGETVRSNRAVAWVRVRPDFPMETRAVIGKVWADLDGDGVQGPGERGVEGVDVWSVNGEVVTTDRDGRFSLRNMAPGRQTYRLDAATLPLEYGLADDPLADLEQRDATGWTTPRVVFRVLPRGARIVDVRLPVPWEFLARPTLVRRDTLVAAGCAETVPLGGTSTWATEAIVLQGVTFGLDRADLSVESRAVLDEVVGTLATHREVRVEVAGHTDATGPAAYNLWLSEMRANAVRRYLGSQGIAVERLEAHGYGLTRPKADNVTREGRAQNRRVELNVIGLDSGSTDVAVVLALREAVATACRQAEAEYTARGTAAYEVKIENPYTTALERLTIGFAPAADSIRVVADGGLDTVYHAASVALPPVPVGGRVRVRAWASQLGDSAAATLRGADSAEELRTAVHNPVRAVTGRGGVSLHAAMLPPASRMPRDATVAVTLLGAGATRENAWAVPEGWSADAATLRDSSGVSVPGAVSAERRGIPALVWSSRARPPVPVTVTLQPARDGGATAEAAAVRVAAARTPDERSAEATRAPTSGPSVAFFAPEDGIVLPTDRLFVGVRGEPGAPVALFDGDSIIGEARLRPDGVHDFIGVRLSEGPHRLRVRMANSWRQDRWDSLAVHVSGPPAAFGREDRPVRLTADGFSEATVSLRLVDAWGVPVVHQPLVTASADVGEVVTVDADPSSVGVQVRPDSAGWVHVRVRAGFEVRPGTLRVAVGDAEADVDLEVLPVLPPFSFTGVGRVGVGANPENFGAITARGRVDARTALVLSYDSRHLDADRLAFGREHDPLEAAQYPILGDAAMQRTLTASRGGFAARLERGFDWIAVGDVLATGFAQDLTLARYGRALTGAAGRVTTGALVWQGFGASTSRQLTQVQLRGAGNAGPYTLAANLEPGTEVVLLETRAYENPERVVSRRPLLRWADYQVDYATGALLFKRPVPASDVSGNPVFIVVTYEAASGGEATAVWGLRVAADAQRAGRKFGLEALGVGATFVHDGAAVGGAYTLGGGDLRVRRGALELGGELSYASSPDSSGFATAVDAALRLGPTAEIEGRWLHLGDGFHNPAAVGLRSGTDEVGVSARAVLAGNELKFDHAWQRFTTEDVSRQQTRGTITRTLLPGLRASAGLSADQMANGAATTTSQAGEFELAWEPMRRLRVWGEGRQQFGSAGAVAFPSHVGAGARFQVTPAIALEARHRQAFLADSGSYGVTNLGLRTQLQRGTEAWGSYQLAGVNGAHNAAVVGLNSRMQVAANWTVSGMVERRVGVGRAAIEDPVRALPFVQDEEDYWSLALGTELLPKAAPYRLSARAELREGEQRSTRLLSAAGAFSFTPALALLSRQELLQDDMTLTTGPVDSRRLWSLWGVALRPTTADRWNVLGKVEWLDVRNPQGGGVLASQGDEARMILTGETIYEASARTELGARYAVRRARATLRHDDGLVQDLWSFAHFMGARARVDWQYGIGARLDARGLLEQTTHTWRYDLAPQAVFAPIPGVEVAAGYRFGSLRDPDFAVNGGQGFFVLLGAQVTERSLASVADFWFDRLGRRE
jgi:uncharacterized repeat protein (TIGR01451 family)